jgi:hypothetical protein
MKAGDFPTWLPAMLVKELRQGLRTRGFVGAFIVFQVIMVLLMVGTVFGSMFGNNMSRSIMANTITGFFWTLLGAQMLLSTPARALGTLQVELDSRALDLLVLTRLTAWRIVLGKWGSLMAQALLLFVAMLPYGIVRYFMGSVDLVQDAQICATMIGGCALLTAAGLACSGLPKIVRVLVPIALVMGFQLIRPLMMMMGGGRTSVGSPFSSGFGTGRGDAWVWWVNGALVLGIFLVTAVRRIAPPAENHVLLTRGLAFATLFPVPVLVAFSKTATARGQLIFAAMLLGIVAAIELSSMRRPMMSHWRPWTKRGPIGRWVGRFALPGWPSAFAFVVFAGVCVGAGLSLPNVAPGPDRVRAVWLVVLAVSSLVFPAMLLSFFGRAGRSPGALYGLVLGVSSLLAAIAGVLANGQPDFKPLLSIASVLPAAGFWITLFAPDQFTDNAFVWQAVVAVIVLSLAWWRARIYWDEIARIDAQMRVPKK